MTKARVFKITLIIPILISILIVFAFSFDGSKENISDVILLAALVFLFWAIALLIGEILSRIFRTSKRTWLFYLIGQVIVICSLATFYIIQFQDELTAATFETNSDYNNKFILKEYDSQLPDSLLQNPEHINDTVSAKVLSVALREMEVKFGNPDAFRINMYSIKKSDTLNKGHLDFFYDVMFRYEIESHIYRSSKLKVYNNEVTFEYFNIE